MQDDRETQWALWRYGVLGPLVSARLGHGDVRAYVREAASRVHVDPDGRAVRLSVRTIEAWFYAWKRGGLKALRRDQRIDRGRTHIREDLQEKLVALKREKPRRSIRRLIRALERKGDVKRDELTKSSVSWP